MSIFTKFSCVFVVQNNKRKFNVVKDRKSMVIGIRMRRIYGLCHYETYNDAEWWEIREQGGVPLVFIPLLVIMKGNTFDFAGKQNTHAINYALHPASPVHTHSSRLLSTRPIYETKAVIKVMTFTQYFGNYFRTCKSVSAINYVSKVSRDAKIVVE